MGGRRGGDGGMGGNGRAGGGWLGGVGGANGGGGRRGGWNGGGAGDGGSAGWLRFSSSTTAWSSVVELAHSPLGASRGSSGEGELGGGGRDGGRVGGEGRLSAARQQPVQSQPSRLVIASQVKDAFSAAHDNFWSHRRVHGLGCAGGRTGGAAGGAIGGQQPAHEPPQVGHSSQYPQLLGVQWLSDRP